MHPRETRTMGNKCFKGQRVSDLGIATGPDDLPEPKPLITVRSVGSRPVDPQRAVNEYHQILNDMQSENLMLMREQLKKKPELFVLNNLVLAIQFFENFDRDKEQILARKTEQESNVDNAIDDIRCRSHLNGALAENVGRRYRYQAKNASLPEVLTSLRYGIHYENMEVYPKEQYASLAAKEYSSVDEPNYRFCLEDCAKTPGWVMLRCVDFPFDQSNSAGVESITYDRIDNDSDCFSKYSDYESLKSLRGPPSLKSTNDASIAQRERMKTPEHSSSSHTDEDEDEVYPVTGADLIRQLEDKIKGNGKLNSSVPLSDNFGKVTQEPVRSQLDVPKSHNKRRRHHEASSDEDYDYSSVNNLPRQLPKLSGMTSDDSGVSSRPRRLSVVPLNCFKTVKQKIVDTVDNPLGLGSQFELKTYFSSAGFFEYFAEGFYDWSERLDRNGQSLQEATAFKSSVCCAEIKTTPDRKYRTNLEFTPVVPVTFWPEIAGEWERRKRPVVIDKRTNIKYRWPRPSQVESIVRQGCELITGGAHTHGRSSPNSKLEWQIAFNDAHETLLMSLTEHHLQALLWARLIFRHVLEPIGVLSYQHLETLFFYMVEENYLNWQAATLGEQIKAIFEKLYSCTSKRRLPHYFVHKRNLLHSKAPRDLFKAQERTFRLNERFVVMTMQAMKQMQSSDSSYPLPDFARLWEIVTTPLSLDSINPALSRPLSTSNIPAENKKRGKLQQPDGFWESVTKQQTTDKTQMMLRQERARLEAEEREKKAASMGDLDRDAIIGPFNVSQTKCLLEFFIEHFIDVAKITNKRRYYDRSNVLLAQAANLASLLKEEGYFDQGEQYLQLIDELKLAARNTIFIDTYVNIPGSPSVFKTGVQEGSNLLVNGVKHSNSFRSSTRSIVGTPLPETPIEKEAKKNLANGHAITANNNGVIPENVRPQPVITVTTVEINAKADDLIESDSEVEATDF